jgi:hypothetical protein
MRDTTASRGTPGSPRSVRRASPPVRARSGEVIESPDPGVPVVRSEPVSVARIPLASVRACISLVRPPLSTNPDESIVRLDAGVLSGRGAQATTAIALPAKTNRASRMHQCDAPKVPIGTRIE